MQLWPSDPLQICIFAQRASFTHVTNALGHIHYENDAEQHTTI